ncbi:MAG: diphosphomevalonate decarboxylase [Saprospiraceae bacterium]|nr:diphosphomevalonate decarboxylase [Saprospiraceae bacterium]
MSLRSKERRGNVAWRSPSNIALIKYWGKYGDQLPQNPSISLTLKNSFTQTRVSYYPKDVQGELSFSFQFQKKSHPGFYDRIRKYLHRVKSYFPFLEDYHLDIESENSFPHSAGIASSASAFSALVLALETIENLVHDGGHEMDLTRVSEIARLGSGSACRSLFPIAALWGKTPESETSSDLHAIPMESQLHDIFKSFHDSILIVSQASKKVSSTAGHSLMRNHPFSKVRYEEARRNLKEMLEALRLGDVERVGFITEMEAMQLHALMLCSNPNFILLQPNTLKIIERLKDFRLTTGIPVYFTLDAGPNVHILYPDEYRTHVQNLIVDQLLGYCDNAQWIQDSIGEGPMKLE